MRVPGTKPAWFPQPPQNGRNPHCVRAPPCPALLPAPDMPASSSLRPGGRGPGDNNVPQRSRAMSSAGGGGPMEAGGDDLSLGRAEALRPAGLAWPPGEADKASGAGLASPLLPPQSELGIDWHFSRLNCPSPGRQAGAAGRPSRPSKSHLRPRGWWTLPLAMPLRSPSRGPNRTLPHH